MMAILALYIYLTLSRIMTTRLLFASMLLLSAQSAMAQFNIKSPEVNTSMFPITDTVYMAPYGNDNHPGTFHQPVKSFERALSLIPFKGPGKATYGLVRLHPGTYRTVDGFRQNPDQWRRADNSEKNVSIEGMGEVIIQGPHRDTFSKGHLIHLLGSHIFIRNLKLRYSELHGILISSGDSRRITDVIIDQVEVDSVKGFGMLFVLVDKVDVGYSAARYCARPGEEKLPPNCGFPSGIKFLGCTHATIHHSEIAYTRGEGLNFHNSQYGRAYLNLLHDNPTQFYCDNSSKLLIYQNHLYNTPSLGKRYWHTCPVDTNELLWSGKAFLLANEGACIYGSAPKFEGCATICTLINETFPNVDSIFIFNNLIQKVGRFIDFWQGNTNVVGVNCIKNVFIWHNTFIENWGMPRTNDHRAMLIHFYFPDIAIYLSPPHYSYGTVQNVRIKHNIFAFDPNTSIPLFQTKHSNIPKLDFLLDANLWSQLPPSHHTEVLPNNIERPSMPNRVPLLPPYSGPERDTVMGILCDSRFHLEVSPINEMPPRDFYGNSRPSSLHRIGAIECQTVSAHTPIPVGQVSIYPVPVKDWLNIDLAPEYQQADFTIEIYHSTGQLVETARSTTRLACGHLPAGFYILVVRGQKWTLRQVFPKE